MKRLPKLNKRSTKFGQYFHTVGKTKRLDGKLVGRMFYLGKEETTAQARLERIAMEWASLQANGFDAWTDEALAKLEAEGVITRAKTQIVKAKDAQELLGEILTDPNERKPFVDERGMIRPELAVPCLMMSLKKFVARYDYRALLFNQLMERSKRGEAVQVIKDVMTLLGGSQAQAVFNVALNGSMSVTPPMTVDATAIDKTAALDALVDAGIVDATPLLPAPTTTGDADDDGTT